MTIVTNGNVTFSGTVAATGTVNFLIKNSSGTTLKTVKSFIINNCRVKGITNDQLLHKNLDNISSEQFVESFSDVSAKSTYYMLINRRTTPFTSGTSGGTDSAPPTPVDDVSSEFYVWDQTIAGKNIASTDVQNVLPRRD